MDCDYCLKKLIRKEAICRITIWNHYWQLCEKHLLSEGERLGIAIEKMTGFLHAHRKKKD